MEPSPGGVGMAGIVVVGCGEDVVEVESAVGAKLGLPNGLGMCVNAALLLELAPDAVGPPSVLVIDTAPFVSATAAAPFVVGVFIFGEIKAALELVVEVSAPTPKELPLPGIYQHSFQHRQLLAILSKPISPKSA